MSFSITNKLFPSNHKTVFVLDHTPYFGISCESPIELEFLKSRTPGFVPMTPICKSLWTSSVESAVEYCRIVWDLFPSGKLVRFIASDTVAHILNTWSPTQQNLSHIMNAMSLIGVPPPHAISRNLEYTVLHGLRAAIEALSDCTDIQAKKKKSHMFGEVQTKLINRCRVICITSARDNDSMKRLEEIFLSVLQQQNKVAAGSDRLLTIDHCHLVIINTFPVNIESQVNNHPPKNVSILHIGSYRCSYDKITKPAEVEFAVQIRQNQGFSRERAKKRLGWPRYNNLAKNLLKGQHHGIKAPLISNKLSTLILEHYNLASTTVTGIPMKEEQNASSSANYDVEIYHSSTAHTTILKGNALDSAAIRTIKDGLEYETVTLKWCTPRGCTGSELQNCTCMHRITPVDVNSRPSLCLINFLLNGRSVMLEMPKKSGGKITSHLLAAHGGEIFIHTLCTARSVLEDPPSISEGCGGRVTDYRITDFGLLIKQNSLVPVKPAHVDEANKPIEKMKTRLNRHTKYWPLTISSTLIFNLKGYIDPLPSIITKEKLTDEEVFQCKRIIYNLISLESKNESLYSLNTGQRVKGQKREDQYKTMWNELETLLKKNLHTPDHRSIYSCLLECHKFNFDEEKLSEKVELDEALRELDHIGPSKIEQDMPRASVIRATTDSPMSPPPLTSITPPITKSSIRSSGIYSAPKTLLDLFTAQDKTKSRPEFSGRLGGGLVAKLYVNNKHGDVGPRGEGMEVE